MLILDFSLRLVRQRFRLVSGAGVSLEVGVGHVCLAHRTSFRSPERSAAQGRARCRSFCCSRWRRRGQQRVVSDAIPVSSSPRSFLESAHFCLSSTLRLLSSRAVVATMCVTRCTVVAVMPHHICADFQQRRPPPNRIPRRTALTNTHAHRRHGAEDRPLIWNMGMLLTDIQKSLDMSGGPALRKLS